MEKIKISRPHMEDLKSHSTCELQWRESPFKDGSLVLWCLDHDVVLLEVGE